MTTSVGVQLTPGQRCLLDLLQRKLLNTIQSYAKLSLERQESGNRDGLEAELVRLKEKIRRISARQKRFTLEIINGNGNNTIPKESFFEALGLVTKEALSKLNSKTNERRRRTTANPRFSHEAIQAKRALEPLQKRLEPRVSKDKRESSRKPQRHQQQQQQQQQQQLKQIKLEQRGDQEQQANSNHNINNNNDSSTNATNPSSATINNNNNNNNNLAEGSNQQAPKNKNNNNDDNGEDSSGTNGDNNVTAKSSNKSASDRYDRNIVIDESRECLVQFVNLQKEIDQKVNQIRDKRESNKRLERQNELIRKRGLEIISAINSINPNITFQEGNNNQLSGVDNQHSQSDQATQLSATGPIDLWIDMKCDESLDGLD